MIQKNTPLDRQQLGKRKLSIDEPRSSLPDHTLVGLNGDEILHEMMIINNVKQICMFLLVLHYLRNS